MVSAKALLAFYAISGIVHSYPLHQQIEDPHHLTTRAPSPRFKNPFDVEGYLKQLDYEIPNNRDIQEWVKKVKKKGALAAAGELSGQHHDEDGHDHDQHTKSAPRPDDNEHDDDDDDDDEDHHMNSGDAAPPFQVARPSGSRATHSVSTFTAVPTTTVGNAGVPILNPAHEKGNGDGIKNNMNAEETEDDEDEDEDDEDGEHGDHDEHGDHAKHGDHNEHGDHGEHGVNELMQPDDVQHSATPTTTLSNTVGGVADGPAAAPSVQTVYIPVNVFPTQFPSFPDMDDEDGLFASSTSLPIFPPPKTTTKANLPSATVSHSPKESTNTNGPKVSATPVNQDSATAPVVTATPDAADAPMTAEQPSDNTDLTTITNTLKPHKPSYEDHFAKLGKLLNLITPKDQSEESY
ncbi:hypothetical protein EYB26_003137 [Talaromyces marneffei]|uniref:uncharacterized protein n=1 Tax=Talaromyces marneffei TaxID=37727 RepID=UPI0012A7BEE5|nr:uncharacterized protein EYB26_003137 [Talaromyces marneffei]QGA15479.1 hypothetical protein EYB26_003137 [Talaromyces marneffei]